MFQIFFFRSSGVFVFSQSHIMFHSKVQLLMFTLFNIENVVLEPYFLKVEREKKRNPDIILTLVDISILYCRSMLPNHSGAQIL